MHTRGAYILILLYTKVQRCMWTCAMVRKDGLNWMLDPKSYPGRKKVPQIWTELCMFHKENLKGVRSKVTVFHERALNVHLSVWHPSSRGSNVQEISQGLPKTLSSFLVLSVLQIFFCCLRQCSGVWQSYTELSVTLQFKVCIMRCMEIWLSLQISGGKMSVCGVSEGLLSRI